MRSGLTERANIRQHPWGAGIPVVSAMEYTSLLSRRGEAACAETRMLQDVGIKEDPHSCLSTGAVEGLAIYNRRHARPADFNADGGPLRGPVGEGAALTRSATIAA